MGSQTKANQLSQRAGQEQLRSPDRVQKTKANRYPGVTIHYAKVVRGLSYPDNDDYGVYILRDIANNYDDYSGEAVYEQGECVKYDGGCGFKFGYKHLAAGAGESGHAPPDGVDDNTYWEFVDIEPKNFAMDTTGDDYPEETDFRYWSRWFYEDDIIPIIKRGNDWYILQEATPLGSPGSTGCSLYWNESGQRLMAVFGGEE